MQKMPPIEKIHEAYSAIVDNRVDLKKGEAKVMSSDYTKEYTVQWEKDVYLSNDNASYWQGYAGYPIIAVLLMQGKLPFNRTIADHFKKINWKRLNSEHKGNYSKAVSVILDQLKAEGINCNEVNNEINKVYDRLKILDIRCKRSSIRLAR
ncbi:hypothetical protein [Bacillus subtilis]|uniref:hypothetical protein n=1 Tax=Bacillus subtilis TaxID=1423 RepID=UPI0034562DF7